MARPWHIAVAAAVAARSYQTAPQWERDEDIRETLADVFGLEGLAALDPDFDPGEESALFASPWGAAADSEGVPSDQDLNRAYAQWAAERAAAERAAAKWTLYPYGRPATGARLLDTAAAWEASQGSDSWWAGQPVYGWRPV